MPLANNEAFSPSSLIRELPSSDLSVFSGVIASFRELQFPELMTPQGRYFHFRKMLGDGTVAGSIFTYLNSLRSAKKKFKPSHPEKEPVVDPITGEVVPDLEYQSSLLVAAFVESAFNDMNGMSFNQLLSQIFFNIIVDGASFHSPIYKVRAGSGLTEEENVSDRFTSDYKDHLIGLQSFINIQTKSIYGFEGMDNSGANGNHLPTGIIQQDDSGNHTTVPWQRVAYSCPIPADGNPLGRPMLIGAFQSWWISNRLAQIMNVGYERNLLGIPVGRIPQDFMRKGATQDQKEVVSYVKKIVTQIKRNHQSGLILPSDTDDKGNKIIDVELLDGPDFDGENVLKAIDYFDAKTTAALSSQFVMTGERFEDLTGVRANMYFRSLDNILECVEDTINGEIEKLLKINNIKLKYRPKFKFGKLSLSMDAGSLSNIVNTTLTSGGLTPDEHLESYIRDVLQVSDDSEYDAILWADKFVDIPSNTDGYTPDMEELLDLQNEIDELSILRDTLVPLANYDVYNDVEDGHQKQPTI
ncbi:hypothetical protein PLEI_1462 [Photobacterium leiognathi lrivu.4.1]|uniref:Uncharacterized protein n=1 Tax=Photobacterium leiognathi lrivu.4.1 TaxID=1248232 RepID=A0A0U1P5H6_PHOLE|nr:hypothetical protein [Photobacterium leiognathi]GAD29809.1 hypothetical protein PLEI_1462 [Photobacterium leiognathi lrivu.4.1]